MHTLCSHLLCRRYSPDPSDSGKIHNDVKQRWLRGDEEVVAGMAQFGDFAARGKAAVEGGDWKALGELMNANFALRRQLYSDGALGTQNLRMKGVADAHGCPAKFPGSGGAMVGMCPERAKFQPLKRDFERQGFVCIELHPNMGPTCRAVSASESEGA